MIQDFTSSFFANITASYVNRRKKNETRKTKEKKRLEVRKKYKIISILYSASLFRHFKHVILNAHKQGILKPHTHTFKT